LRRGGALAVCVVLMAGCGGVTGSEGTGAGSLPFDGRSPLVPPARQVRVLVELRRPSLAAQMARGSYPPARQRAYVSSLGQEVAALQSALEAKNVKLRQPLEFARVWDGFAATVDAKDLPELRALGLRAEPVRRFFGAAGAQGAGGGAQGAEGVGATGAGKPVVALLDSAVDRGAPGLLGRVVPGFDAVRTRPGPRERHGTQVAQVLAQALGPRAGSILAIRVAGLQPDPSTGGRIEVGTTDQLLAGLERAVDPNGDGDTSDHVPVALVGVNSPYSGFGDSPDAVAAGAARALGTLVVAPAGNEGRGGGILGTVGSPAAAPGVLAVGALDGGGAPALPGVRLGLATSEGRALLRGTLLGGGGHALRGRVATLMGPSQASPRERGRALGGSPLEYFGVDASPRAGGRVVIVPARSRSTTAGGPPLSARAAAAADAGAAALVVCEPDPRRSLTATADAAPGIPVIGLRGAAAARALELTQRDGGIAFVSAPQDRTARGAPAPARSSSQGPSYGLAPKPELAAPGTARVAIRGGGGQVVAGTSVAAARVAAAAVGLHADRPLERPDDLIAALVTTARPVGAQLSAGAGRVDVERAKLAAVLIEPAPVGMPRQPAGAPFTVTKTLVVHNTYAATEQMTLTASVPGLQATVAPATVNLARNGRQAVTLTVSAAGTGHTPGWVSGRLTARGSGVTVSSPIGLPVGPPPPARLGPLTLIPPRGRTDGVRFTAGFLTVRGGVRSVEPLGRLRLQLVDSSGRVARELTPPGGAPDLLPGEYAYTLTASARRGLGKGSYSFVARGRGPAGGPELVRKSRGFTVR
jgi:hypothetical protein